MDYLIVFFTSLIFTLGLTPYLIDYLIKIDVVDKPSKRRVNQSAVPRMGGLGVVFVSLAMLGFFYDDLASLQFFFIGSALIVFCGAFDDAFTLSWSKKFILQFFSAAFLLVHFLPQFNTVVIFGVEFPPAVSHLIFLVFIAGAINSLNLMDGLDGLVGGFSLVILTTLAALSLYAGLPVVTLFAVSLVGGVIGFLKFNAYPAKIYLGDVGSLTLGYFLVFAAVAVSLRYQPATLDLTFPIILLGVPILDTMKVMLLRILNKTNPFLPDKNHFHHVLFGNKVRHKVAVFFIHGTGLAFVTLALFYLKTGPSVYITIAFALLALGIFSAKPLARIASRMYPLRESVRRVYDYPADFLRRNRRVIVGHVIAVSTVAAVAVLVSTFPVSSSLDVVDLVAFVVVGLLFLAIALLHNRMSDTVQHFYIFVNLAIYFLFNHIDEIFNPGAESAPIAFSNPLFVVAALTLSVVVVFFLLNRNALGSRGSMIYLSGLDLIVIVSITLTFILESFFQSLNISVLAVCLLLSFVLYLWYRIVSSLVSSGANYFFYLSFLPPQTALFTLIFMK
jgi:UDP-GlcNAc:undecaprenyl-phosphate/decaprenyl-phosphate GlcNAc-1-phosphate transferase